MNPRSVQNRNREDHSSNSKLLCIEKENMENDKIARKARKRIKELHFVVLPTCQRFRTEVVELEAYILLELKHQNQVVLLS
ncbi:hypothetical protein NL676_003763 [Syzygium grande]|nr:hypothetical protein NL676_003763 [Syzygium grande]